MELPSPTLKDAKTVAFAGKLTALPGLGTFYSIVTLKFDTSNFSEFTFLNLAGYKETAWRHDFAVGAAGVGVDGALNTNPHVWLHTYNDGTNTLPASYTAQFDGTAQTIVATGAFGRIATDRGSIGARIDSTGAIRGGSGASMDLAEIVIYNSVLSALDRQRIERYFADKYNLALSYNLSWDGVI